MPSNLEVIQEALVQSEEIGLVASVTEPSAYADAIQSGIVVRRDVYLAPCEPEYNPRKLDKLAAGFVPDLETSDPPEQTSTTQFEREGQHTYWVTWRGLVIGVRRYRDIVGSITITGSMAVEGREEDSGFESKRYAFSEMAVRIFPDSNLARLAMAGTIGKNNIINARDFRRSKQDRREASRHFLDSFRTLGE